MTRAGAFPLLLLILLAVAWMAPVADAALSTADKVRILGVKVDVLSLQVQITLAPKDKLMGSDAQKLENIMSRLNDIDSILEEMLQGG